MKSTDTGKTLDLPTVVGRSNNCSSATHSLLHKSLSVESVINAGLADRQTNRDEVWAKT